MNKSILDTQKLKVKKFGEKIYCGSGFMKKFRRGDKHTSFSPGLKILDFSKEVSKPQNREIKYLRNKIHTEFEILFFRVINQSTYSNEIRVYVTYLITTILINNRKIDIRWDLSFLFLVKLRNIILVKSFAITKSRN